MSKITTQQVVDYLIVYAGAHQGECPKEWPTLVSLIDDSESTQRQLLYKLLYRKTLIPQHKLLKDDPEIQLYSETLEDMGVKRICRR